GEWQVSAVMLNAAHSARRGRGSEEQASAAGLSSTRGPLTRLWYGWAPAPDSASPVKTCPAPFVKVPGALPLIWAAMVTVGFLLALLIQSMVLSRDHVVAGAATIVTIAAIAVGIAGAKVWFVVKHRSERRFEGWCIQGFITGASAAALLLFTLTRAPTG